MKKLSAIIFSLVLILGIGLVATHVNAQAVAGCTTSGGYNTTTGMSCNGATVIPLGCTSPAGFSASTGMPCNGNTAAVNGYSGTMINSVGYLDGCSSTAGYSATTGQACNMPINGVIYTGNGTTVNTGVPSNTVVTTTAPGLPTTGAGQNTLVNSALLLGSAVAAGFAARALVRSSTVSAD